VLGVTVALLGVFTLWMGWVRARRLRVRCGCFGGGGEVGPRTIVRNLVLLAVALVALGLSGGTVSALPGPSLSMLVTATSLAVVLALLVCGRLGRNCW
jgi:hypothetical protein